MTLNQQMKLISKLAIQPNYRSSNKNLPVKNLGQYRYHLVIWIFENSAPVRSNAYCLSTFVFLYHCQSANTTYSYSYVCHCCQLLKLCVNNRCMNISMQCPQNDSGMARPKNAVSTEWHQYGKAKVCSEQNDSGMARPKYAVSAEWQRYGKAKVCSVHRMTAVWQGRSMQCPQNDSGMARQGQSTQVRCNVQTQKESSQCP